MQFNFYNWLKNSCSCKQIACFPFVDFCWDKEYKSYQLSIGWLFFEFVIQWGKPFGQLRKKSQK